MPNAFAFLLLYRPIILAHQSPIVFAKNTARAQSGSTVQPLERASHPDCHTDGIMASNMQYQWEKTRNQNGTRIETKLVQNGVAIGSHRIELMPNSCEEAKYVSHIRGIVNSITIITARTEIQSTESMTTIGCAAVLRVNSRRDHDHSLAFKIVTRSTKDRPSSVIPETTPGTVAETSETPGALMAISTRRNANAETSTAGVYFLTENGSPSPSSTPIRLKSAI
jgi:hypothetical protein